jgi:hypothetical protein
MIARRSRGIFWAKTPAFTALVFYAFETILFRGLAVVFLRVETNPCSGIVS